MDQITVELVHNRLLSHVRTMSELLKRATYSPAIREVHDYSNGMHDINGDVVAQAAGIPGLFGVMSHSMRAAIEHVGIDAMRPGDVIIANDPYTGGNLHLNDINVIAPIFHGGELVMFAQSKAHWLDIGSRDPGGWSADATDIFQEGLRIPPLKLVSEGQWNEEVMTLITANTRLPEPVRGDLAAQIAAMNAGQRGASELCEIYGRESVLQCLERILEQGEASMRDQIAGIPDGEYSYEDFGDDDGAGNTIKVAIRVRVEGSGLTVDCSGSASQGAMSIANLCLPGTAAMVRLALKCMLDPHTPYNDGAFRAVDLVVPDGSCLNAELPAAVTVGVANAGHALLEGTIKALAPVVPERAIADQHGSVQVMLITGPRPDGTGVFIHGLPYAGGGGARAAKDGVSAIITLVDGDITNIPVEVLETTQPLRVQRYELMQDSGGPGRTRGGLGVRTDYRILAEQATVSTMLNRTTIPPAGIDGGASPPVCRVVRNPYSDTPEVAHGGLMPVVGGDIVSNQMGGGAGFGPAFERDPESVAQDVREGYVSRTAARESYGVELDDRLEVDNEATTRARSSLVGSPS